MPEQDPTAHTVEPGAISRKRLLRMALITVLLSVLWVIAAGVLFVLTMPVAMSATQGTNIAMEIALRGCMFAPIGLGIALVLSWCALVAQGLLHKTERWAHASQAARVGWLAHSLAALWIASTLLAIVGIFLLPVHTPPVGIQANYQGPREVPMTQEFRFTIQLESDVSQPITIHEVFVDEDCVRALAVTPDSASGTPRLRPATDGEWEQTPGTVYTIAPLGVPPEGQASLSFHGVGLKSADCSLSLISDDDESYYAWMQVEVTGAP